MSRELLDRGDRIRRGMSCKLLLLAALAAPGCGGENAAPETVDDSAWGGAARLSPVLSIGVDEGPEELIFGRIVDFALGDAHVYVLEMQPAVIRKFDHDGNWVADLGRAGQGPGEFSWPSALVVDEQSDRIWVEHKNPTSMTVISTEGEPREPLTVELWRARGDLRMTDRGLARTVTLVADGKSLRRDLALEWLTETGEVTRIPLARPDAMPASWTIECGGGGLISIPVPFAPDFHWALLPDGAWISGTSDAYRFTIHGVGGRDDIVVERPREPVRVDPDEAAWRASLARGGAKCGGPGTEPVGPEIPAVKQAYDEIFSDGAGRIWVVREGAGRRLEPCGDPNADWAAAQARPCWESPRLVDVFDRDGTYLGPLHLPADMLLSPRPVATRTADGERVLAVTLDELGVYRMTWYRLTLPDRAS